MEQVLFLLLDENSNCFYTVANNDHMALFVLYDLTFLFSVFSSLLCIISVNIYAVMRMKQVGPLEKNMPKWRTIEIHQFKQ